MTASARYCPDCTFVVSNATTAVVDCPRCHAAMHHRLPQSLTRTTAFGLAGLFMLVPANVLPVVSLNLLGQARTDTILSGVLSLWRDGLWGIAVIVFTASILVPVLKLVSLGVLIHAVRRKSTRRRHALTKLFATVRFIGRWSMLDVFLVAFLTGAVQFGSLARVHPEPGVIAFAATVVFTVLATESFDSRLLWDDEPALSPSSP